MAKSTPAVSTTPPPTPAVTSPPVLGRYVGFEAVAKERFRLVVLDTVNGEVAERVEIDNGRAMPMHSAFHRFNSVVNKMVRFFLSNLWRFNPAIVGKDEAAANFAEYEKAQKTARAIGGK